MPVFVPRWVIAVIFWTVAGSGVCLLLGGAAWIVDRALTKVYRVWQVHATICLPALYKYVREREARREADPPVPSTQNPQPS